MIHVEENEEKQKNVHNVMGLVKYANKYGQYLVSSSKLEHVENVVVQVR